MREKMFCFGGMFYVLAGDDDFGESLENINECRLLPLVVLFVVGRVTDIIYNRRHFVEAMS
jgi:hypothetical protein